MRDENYFKKFIITIPDFPKKGILFRDITPSIENIEAFTEIINSLADIAKQYEFNKIICADARGFLFGAALGYKLQKDIVMARKPNKLPRPGFTYSYSLEYGESTLQVSEGSINKNDRILVIDDLLATGGSALAMMELLTLAGAQPVAAMFYIELPDLKGAENIQKRFQIPVHSLVKFEGE